MRKLLTLVFLLLLSVTSRAHVVEIRVNQAQDGTLTWYLVSYHTVTECGIGSSGLTINGTNYPIQQIFAGDAAAQSPNVFASHPNYPNSSRSGWAISYGKITTPFLGTSLNVAPYSNNQCWAFLVSGSGTFTPPPPPVCSSCPTTGWSNTTGLVNNNGTSCDPTDDLLSTTVAVNHLACANITGDKQFSVVFDPGGANATYGPFNYNAGVTTNVTINVPYGTSNSTQLSVVDSDFPCTVTHGLSMPGGQFNGNTPPVATLTANGPTTFCQGGSVMLNAGTGAGYTYQWIDGNGDPVGDATNSSSYSVSQYSSSYKVAVTANGCTKLSAPINVVVNLTPAPFIVSGGGGYCFGSTGAPVALSGSQTGVNYQLMLGSNLVGSPVAGTGNALTFPNQTTAGTYTVVANNATAACTTNMIGSATVVAPSAGLSYTITTANPDCTTLNSGSATLSGVAGGIAPYQYSVGSGAYSSSNVLGGLVPGVYQVNVKDAAGCMLSKSVSIIKPFCSIAVNDSILNCGGNAINIPLSQLLTNDMIAAGDTIAIGDWSNNATGGGTVTYNSASKMFTYTPPALGFNGQASFNYTIKKNDNTVAFSGNGHFYEFKPGGITWTNAKNAAGTLFYNGMQGYLATVTSAAENAFINTKLQANGWMGASDLASEGTWRWVTGPEGLEDGGLGRHFTNQNKGGGNCSAGIGSAVNGNYINWAGGEPNDCGAFYGPGNTNPLRPGEHVAHFYAGSGTWNDFPDNAGVDGYVVEYGGLEVVAPVTLTSTATVYINNATVVASSTTTAPLCPGANNGTITVSATGGASPYQYSNDNGGTFKSANSFADLTAGGYLMKVKDANGCTVAHVANIVAGVDNSAPTVSCPSNITVNATTGICGAAVTFPAATGTDNCTAANALTFTYSQNSGTVFPVGTTNVTVTAKDGYNNTSAPCTFTVTVLDVEAPFIACPNNIVVSNGQNLCGAVVNYALPTATDNCSGSTGATTTKTMLFNGSSTTAQSYTEQGMTFANAPGQHLDCPWSISGGQGARIHGNFTTTWTNSGGQTFSPISVRIASNPANHKFISSTGASVSPTTTGVFTFPNTADWRGITSMKWNNVAGSDADIDDFTFSDGVYSTGPAVTRTSPSATASGSLFPVGTTTVSFKATDASGNESDCSFTVTVEDTQLPSITAPANVVVAANSSCNATGVNLGTPVTSDNCQVQSVTNNAPATFPKGNTTVTWTVTDNHNNVNTATQVVTVNDSTAPVLTLPANATVSCDGSTATSANGTATATDNCGAVTVAYTDASTQSSNTNSIDHYNYVITRTWKAVDASGNSSTADQIITVQDVIAPGITVPANATASCDGSISTAATGSATGEDNCSPVTITYTDANTQDADVSNPGHYNYVVTRTWKAEDVAGNSITANQTITVQDIKAPAITAPANATVNCQDATTIEALGSASGSDNCSPVVISYTDASTQDMDVNNAGHYNYIITRTWKATDVTGNSITSNQIITVQDVTNPSVDVPANATVNCQDATTVEALGLATGSDNCGPVSITYTDVNTQNASVNNAGHYNYTITRTWKATDVTGNFSAVDQTITVQDVTNPALVVPSNTTVSCDGSTTTDNNGFATGSDNCGPVAITYADASTQDANVNNMGHYNYTITRTWKATDITGNYVTGEQTITVQDVTAPAISCPANTYASCKTTTEYNGAASGSDNCGPVKITYTDASTKSANSAAASYYDYTITRTWKAADVTGNYTTANQLINVSEMRGAAIAVTPVNTINSNHPNHTIYLGYGPQSVTLDATVTGGVGNRTYSWSPTTGVANANAATTSVAPTATTTYTVTITDATGCTIQKSITINVIDVRCGNKIQICHFPPGNPGNVQQQCLPASAIAAHLAHGCKLGACPQAKFNESEDEHSDDLIAAEMKVYPNPTTGVFTIELPSGMESADVVIMDMTGKIIDRKTAMQGNRLQFDLSNVARGAYMVQTTSGGNVYRSRIVLQ